MQKTQQPNILLMISSTLRLLSGVVIANLESIIVYEQWKLFFPQCMTFHLLTLISSVISLLNIMRLFCHSSHPAYAFTLLINSLSVYKISPLSSPPFHSIYELRSLESSWFLPVKSYDSPYSTFYLSPSSLGEGLLLLCDNSASLLNCLSIFENSSS